MPLAGKQIRRNILKMGTTIPLAQLLAACGGGGGDGHTVQSDHTPPNSTSLDKATFLIVYKHAAVNGGRELVTPLGTGFSINDKYIATNAHMTVGIMDQAVDLYPGHEITKVSAYQASTGEEYPLVLAVTHPGYVNSTSGPDAGLFQTTRVMTDHLRLATLEEAQSLKIGQEVTISGFPGELYPGFTEDTIPVATVFKGTIQAFRTFDNRIAPTPTNYDQLDVSAQLTPGTSGSAILVDNKVVALNNAGPEYYVLTPPAQPGGQPGRARIASGANNYGVHVKFLHQLVEAHEKGGMSGRDHLVLPPSRQQVAANAPNNGGGGEAAFAGFTGAIANPAHNITISVTRAGKVTGTSTRGQGLTLSGDYMAAQGNTPGHLMFTDNVQTNAAQGQYQARYRINYNLETGTATNPAIYEEARGVGGAFQVLGQFNVAGKPPGAQGFDDAYVDPLKPKLRV